MEILYTYTLVTLGKHLMRLLNYRGVFVYVSIQLPYMEVAPHRMTLL